VAGTVDPPDPAATRWSQKGTAPFGVINAKKKLEIQHRALSTPGKTQRELVLDEGWLNLGGKGSMTIQKRSQISLKNNTKGEVKRTAHPQGEQMPQRWRSPESHGRAGAKQMTLSYSFAG